jgi:hypothetical protein
MEKRMEKRIERIKAHSSAVYRKDSPPKAPRFFVLLSTPSLCGTELFAVTPQGNGRVGRCGRGSKRKRSSLSLSRLGLDASFFLLIDGQLVWKEEKANDTQRKREREY